jgi:hypothetical protein
LLSQRWDTSCGGVGAEMREVLYIGGGLAAGYFLGKMLFGDGLSKNPKAPWRIRQSRGYDKGFYTVVVDKKNAGWIDVWTDAETKKKRYRGKHLVPTEQGWDEQLLSWHDSPDEAAQEIYDEVTSRFPDVFPLPEEEEVIEPTLEDLTESLPSYSDPESLEPIQRVSVAKPPFVEDASVWSTPSPTRLLLMRGDDPIGFIEGAEGSYSGTAYVGDKQVYLVQGTTRKNAVGVVYAANLLMHYLFSQRDYSTVTVRSPSHYEEVYNVKTWRPRLLNARDIAETLDIPETLIVEVGITLAKAKRIFGVSGRVTVQATLTREQMLVPGIPTRSDDPALRERHEKELARARRQRRRGKKSKIEHRRRRVVTTTDVPVLRKSDVLSKEEKKALPKAKSVKRYSFALYGPDGSTGFFQADSKKVRQILDVDWLEEDRQRFQKRLEEREKAEEEAAQKEAELLSKIAAKKMAERPERPYYASRDEALRRLFTQSEQEPTGAYFEEKRLEGFDWATQQQIKRERKVRAVDAAMRRVERLQRERDAARERLEKYEAKGHLGRAAQAASTMQNKQAELDVAVEKLAEAQKALQGM